jgi:hypothetical protein
MKLREREKKRESSVPTFAKSFISTGWAGASATSEPTLPTSAIWLNLYFGSVFTPPGFLQLQSETRREAWQNTMGYAKPISDDALAYAGPSDASGAATGDAGDVQQIAQAPQGIRAQSD